MRTEDMNGKTPEIDSMKDKTLQIRSRLYESLERASMVNIALFGLKPQPASGSAQEVEMGTGNESIELVLNDISNLVHDIEVKLIDTLNKL